MSYFLITTVLCSRIGLFSKNTLLKKSKSGDIKKFLPIQDDGEDSIASRKCSLYEDMLYCNLHHVFDDFEDVISRHLCAPEISNFNNFKNDADTVVKYLKFVFKLFTEKENSLKFSNSVNFKYELKLLHFFIKTSNSKIYQKHGLLICMNILKRKILNLLLLRVKVINRDELNRFKTMPVHCLKKAIFNKTFKKEKIIEVEQNDLLDLFNINYTSEFKNKSYLQTCKIIHLKLILQKYEAINDVSLQDSIKKYMTVRKIRKGSFQENYDSISSKKKVTRMFSKIGFDSLRLKSKFMRKPFDEFDTFETIEISSTIPSIDSIFHVLSLALRDVMIKDSEYFTKIKSNVKNSESLYNGFKEFVKETKNFKLAEYFYMIHVLKKTLSEKIDFTAPFFKSYFQPGCSKHNEEKDDLKNYSEEDFKITCEEIFTENLFEIPSTQNIIMFLKPFSEIFKLNIKLFDYDQKTLVYGNKKIKNALGLVKFAILKSKLYFIKNEPEMPN